MGFDINKVFISGRLVKDPELKKISTADGNNFDLLTFTIANSASKDGDNTNFFDCQMWGKSANYFLNKLSKGSALIVEGTLKQRRWTNQQDNSKHSKININVEKIVLINYSKPADNSLNINPAAKHDIDTQIDIVSQEDVQDVNYYEDQIDSPSFDDDDNKLTN